MTDQLQQVMVVTVSAETIVPVRCTTYWKIDAQLMRLYQNRKKGDGFDNSEEDSDPLREIQLKMDLHFRICPSCRAWWQMMTDHAKISVYPTEEV